MRRFSDTYLWQTRAKRLLAFQEAYENYINLAEVTQEEDSWSARPRSGVDPESFVRAERLVAKAAGGAQGAGYDDLSRVEVYDLKTNKIPWSEVIPNWQTPYKDPTWAKPQDILNAVAHAVGYSEQKAEDAARYERGLLGFLVYLLVLPRQVRDLAGLRDNGLMGRLVVLIVLGLEILLITILVLLLLQWVQSII